MENLITALVLSAVIRPYKNHVPTGMLYPKML